jgi:alpha-tubulin suppressor-like RCC1 family protein
VSDLDAGGEQPEEGPPDADVDGGDGSDAGGRDAAPEPDGGPDPEPPRPVGWSSVAVGGDYACGVTTLGRVMCWGSLQGGDGLSPSPIPVEIPGLNEVEKIAASQLNTCAAMSDGTASCWGLFLADGTSNALPKQMMLFNVDTLVPTTDRACALLLTGTVSCFDSTTSTPQPLVELGPAKAIDGTRASGRHYCAVTNSETVSCWGDDNFMAGDYPGVDFSQGWTTPLPVPNLLGATQIAVGDDHNCALANGQVICWGDNSNGQIGIGETPIGPHLRPTQVLGLPPAIAIDAGASSTCAVLEDHTLSCWGLLGQNALRTPVTIPRLSDVVSVSVGFNSVCVVKTDQTAWCFGDNGYGQLGNPQAVDSLEFAEDLLGPVRVLGPELSANATD